MYRAPQQSVQAKDEACKDPPALGAARRHRPSLGQRWNNRTLIGHERVDSQFFFCLVVNEKLLRLLSSHIIVSY